jgi:hypothetical protein
LGIAIVGGQLFAEAGPAAGHEVGIGDCRTVRAKSKSFTATTESNGCSEFSESFSSRDVEARAPMLNIIDGISARRVRAGKSKQADAYRRTRRIVQPQTQENQAEIVPSTFREFPKRGSSFLSDH